MAKQESNLLKDRADIQQKWSSAKTFSAGWHRNVERWRRLYDFNHYSEDALSGEQRYIDPSYTNGVDVAVGILQSNEWVWKSRGLNPSSKEEKGTSIIEKAIAGFIDSNSNRYQYDLKYETNLNFVRDGGACLYGVWDKFLHDNCYEEMDVLDADGNIDPMARVYYDLPLRIEVIDPLQIYLLPGGPKRWLCVTRSEKMSVYDVEETYQVELARYKGTAKQTKIDTPGELLDYWELAYELRPDKATDYEGLDNPEQVTELPMRKHLVVRNAILFNEEFVRPLRIMDGYKDIPYTVNFYNPASREDSAKWHSFISPLEHPVRELEDTTNMRKRLMLLYTGLPLVARTRSGSKSVTIDKNLGKVINLKEGEDLGFPEWRGTPPDVDKHLEFARSRIQQSGFTDVMFGEGPGSTSGYGLSLMTDQNRIRLEPPITHLENMWTWAARKWVDLATQFAPDYYMELYGHIRGEDFASRIKGGDLDNYNIRCEIKPEFPNEKVRNHAMATQVMNILSDRTLMERYLDIQQPDDERQMKLQELAENNPITAQYALMKELQRRADEGDETAAMVLQKMQEAEGNTANVGGRPEEPVAPAPPTGLQTQNGLPPEQQFAGQDQMRMIQEMGGVVPQMGSGEVE